MIKYQVVCFYFDEFMGWTNYVYKEVDVKNDAEKLVYQLNDDCQLNCDCQEYYIIKETY